MFKVSFTARGAKALTKAAGAALIGALLSAPSATLASGAADAVVLQTSALHSLSRNRFEPPRVPPVLSAQDIARYKRIFALQEDGKWQQAKREIEALKAPPPAAE